MRTIRYIYDDISGLSHSEGGGIRRYIGVYRGVFAHFANPAVCFWRTLRNVTRHYRCGVCTRLHGSERLPVAALAVYVLRPAAADHVAVLRVELDAPAHVRPVCWQATSVEPLPPNVSRTTSPRLVEFLRRYTSISVGFMVGWTSFFFGLLNSMTVVCERSPYHECAAPSFQP